MTDIIKRLEEPMAWASIKDGVVRADDAPFEAAKEIERLRLRIDRLEDNFDDGAWSDK